MPLVERVLLWAQASQRKRLPRQVRLLLFGNSHWEIDISGAHYELMRRQCKSAAVHLGLPAIAQVREFLREALGTHIAVSTVETVVKTWPLVILNSATPQEAIEYLKKRFIGELPYSLVSFAREVFSASRYVMNHPPPWCPPVAVSSGRGAPFRFFEVLEQRVTWTAYSFLQSRVGFTSAIWLHDGFWITPRPGDEMLAALHSHLCQTFGYDLMEAPLMRCDSLQPKRAHLLAECTSPSPIISSRSQASFHRPLPTAVRFHRKRIFTVAHPEDQEALEQRLMKRARKDDIKRRRRF